MECLPTHHWCMFCMVVSSASFYSLMKANLTSYRSICTIYHNGSWVDCLQKVTSNDQCMAKENYDLVIGQCHHSSSHVLWVTLPGIEQSFHNFCLSKLHFLKATTESACSVFCLCFSTVLQYLCCFKQHDTHRVRSCIGCLCRLAFHAIDTPE